MTQLSSPHSQELGSPLCFPLGQKLMCSIASGWMCGVAHTVQGGSFWTTKDVSYHAKKKTPKLPIPQGSCGEEKACIL